MSQPFEHTASIRENPSNVNPSPVAPIVNRPYRRLAAGTSGSASLASRCENPTGFSLQKPKVASPLKAAQTAIRTGKRFTRRYSVQGRVSRHPRKAHTQSHP
jgi:hypothetical protein